MQQFDGTDTAHEMESRLRLACSAAIKAGQTIKEIVAAGDIGTELKGQRDVVTRADMLAEQSLVGTLRTSFPADGIVAEEGSSRETASGLVWYLDPLDGTLNFSRGLPIWCVSIAAFKDGRPVLGVVHDPLRGETFSGAEGLGAWLNGETIGVRRDAQTANSVVHLTVDFHDETIHLCLRDIAAIAPRVLRTRNFGAVALALAYCAAGRVDAVIHRSANPWDYGAGVVLVKEAGGPVTSLEGHMYEVQHGSILASANASVHGDLLALINQQA